MKNVWWNAAGISGGASARAVQHSLIGKGTDG